MPAPISAVQGTAVPFAGRTAAPVTAAAFTAAAFTAAQLSALDGTDGNAKGSPPREAPV
jgi:hypothetical protein